MACGSHEGSKSLAIDHEEKIFREIEPYGMAKLFLKAGPIYARSKCPRVATDVEERWDAI
jgi:hypothetical protein